MLPLSHSLTSVCYISIFFLSTFFSLFPFFLSKLFPLSHSLTCLLCIHYWEKISSDSWCVNSSIVIINSSRFDLKTMYSVWFIFVGGGLIHFFSLLSFIFLTSFSVNIYFWHSWLIRLIHFPTYANRTMHLLYIHHPLFHRPKDKREIQASIRTTTEKNTILTRLNSELNQELAEVRATASVTPKASPYYYNVRLIWSSCVAFFLS